MKKLFHFLIVLQFLFFTGCTFNKAKKAQEDFNYICQVYKEGLTKIKSTSVDLPYLTSEMYQKLEQKIKVREIKQAIRAIESASTEVKYSLMQMSATELKATFNCHEYEEFMTESYLKKTNTIDPIHEGDPDESL